MSKELLQAALPSKGFCDLRYQTYQLTSLKGTKQEIDAVQVVKKQGGNVRALVGGGFGTYCFTDVKDIGIAFEEALQASAMIPGTKALNALEINTDTVLVQPTNDPRNKTISEKRALLQGYMDLFMAYDEIVNLESEYYEQFTDTLILNNQGTDIRQEELICGITFRITSKRGDLTQITRLSFGGCQEFSDLENQEEAIHEKAKQTIALLDAKPIKGGNYDVVLDSDVAGLFIHEAFGHLSESDNLIGNAALAKTMTLGTTFADSNFSVYDDPTLIGYPGTYVYDHEGTRAKRTPLIEGGKLTGRLHSLESASLLGEVATGHARAKNFGFTPIVRMGNIFIQKGQHTLEEMIASIDQGLYLFGSAGGQTTGDTFTFAVQGGYWIEKGKISHMVRDVALTGHLFTTLKQIDMIGDSVAFSKAGGCGKGGQILIQSGKGAAPIRIKQMGIGGQ